MEKQLPKNWIEVQLIDILEVLENGSRPKGGVQGIFDGVPSLGGEHLNSNGGFKFGKLKYVPTSFAEKMNRGKIKENDILIVKDGATTGKTSFIDNNFPFDLAFVNEHVFICRTFPNLNSKCVFYFLFGKSGFNRIMENFTGSAQGGINQKFARNTLIPLPPLAEQNRIVEKLDNLFNQLETIKASMANIPLLIKDFRQQVLTQAVTGKLTRCKVEIKRLGDLLTDVKYGTSMKSEYGIDGTPIFRIPNINDGEINDTDLKYSILEVKEYNQLKLVAGDVLIIRSNGSVSLVGRSAIIRKKHEDFAYAGYLIRLRCGEELKPDFLNYTLKSSFLREQIVKTSHSSSGVNNINSQEIKDLKIYWTSPKKQQEIVSRVESLFAKADAIDQQYKSLKQMIDTLPQALLHKAFKGELTEQLDSDGDARELLQQIQQLKEATTKAGKNIKSKTQISKAKKVKNYPENEEVLRMVAEHQ